MRNTKNLNNIISCLSQSPMTAVELNDALSDTDKTVVYRTIKRLIANNQLSEIQLSDGSIAYELNKQDHHHHLICKSCNDIQCVDLPGYLSKSIDQFENDLSQITPIVEHRVDFFINCHNCK